MKEIYLAGGCFWGVEHYFSLIKGIGDVESGYCQSNIENPSYEQLIKGESTGCECVKVTYDNSIITYKEILKHFFKAIDPTTLNRQGPDVGMQYRSGIYYQTEEEKNWALDYIKEVEPLYNKPIVVEVESLRNYYKAEEYHQDYLVKNPNGYCHINFNIIDSDDLK